MVKHNILIVDDDPGTRRSLESTLSENAYKVYKAASSKEAFAVLETSDIQLVILAFLLPDDYGLETLKRIRYHPLLEYIPVVMLNFRDSEIDTVLSLELGADDCLSKPVRHHELLARIKAILRRVTISEANQKNKKLVVGKLIMDLANRSTVLNGQELELSFKEFEILAMLIKNPGKVFTREIILDSIWSEGYYNETRTVDVHIRRIRKKAEGVGQKSDFIETVRHVGYRLVAQP